MIRVSLAICVAVLIAAATQSGSPKIGVVQFSQIFEGYEKKDVLQSQLESEGEALKKKPEEMDDQVTKLRSELELLDRNTSKYREMEKQILHLMQDVNYERKLATEQLNGKKSQFHEQIIKEIRAGITRYGKEHGYTMILQREFTLASEIRSWRSVLFHSAETEITLEVLAELNEK